MAVQIACWLITIWLLLIPFRTYLRIVRRRAARSAPQVLIVRDERGAGARLTSPVPAAQQPGYVKWGQR